MSHSYVILSIHGLGPKPAADVFRENCKRAILEGLRRNLGQRDSNDVNFQTIYWAVEQLNPDPEPYQEAAGTGPFRTYKQGRFDTVREIVGTLAGSALDRTEFQRRTHITADVILGLKSKFEDLDRYYHQPEFQSKLREQLKAALAKVQDKRIMLIAHSMGSIIAYDVLRDFGKTHPHFRLDHLVTLGSPLGLYEVKGRMEHDYETVRTPSIVQKWDNFADKRDYIAVDAHLRDDYDANDQGIQVKDTLVLNNYVSPALEGNPHKIYGYLRTPEVSEVIQRFI